MSESPDRGLRRLLRRGGFRDLLVGQGVSALGDWMGTIALMALVLDLTGSSAAVAVILVLRLAPAALAGPLTTRAVGRWNRRRTMLAMDGARAVIVILVPLISAVWWVYLWAFLLEVGGLIFLPARDSAIPELVAHDEDRPLADGLVLASSYGTIPLGAGLFGAASALMGGFSRTRLHGAAPVVFFVDALTFVVSFAMVWRIPNLDGPGTGRRAGPTSDAGGHGEEHTFVAALRLPLVRTVAPAAAVAALGIGSLFSLGIVFVRDVLHASNTQFGVLVALFGVGAAGGLGVMQWKHLRGLLVVRTSLAVQGMTISGMSLAPTVEVAFIGALMFGATTAVVLAAAMDVLQQQLSDQQRVNAFAVFHIIIRAGLALAAVGAGIAGDAIAGVRWPGFGQLAPARVVLLCSGGVVMAGALMTSGLAGRLPALAGGELHPAPAAHQAEGDQPGQGR